MKTLNLILVVLLANETLALTSLLYDQRENSTRVLRRDKRFLVFVPNGGIVSWIMGYLGPIDIPAWQNINCMRNMRYQYELPQKWVYDPPSFPGWKGRSLGADKSESKPHPKPDSTRKVAYEIVEGILDKEGKHGRDCMLRAICEVAETPVKHNGLIGELLHIFFTPQHEKLNQDYHDARKVGLNRVDCERMYPKCPMGHGILDSFSLLKEFEFQNWLNF